MMSFYLEVIIGIKHRFQEIFQSKSNQNCTACYSQPKLVCWIFEKRYGSKRTKGNANNIADENPQCHHHPSPKSILQSAFQQGKKNRTDKYYHRQADSIPFQKSHAAKLREFSMNDYRNP